MQIQCDGCVGSIYILTEDRFCLLHAGMVPMHFTIIWFNLHDNHWLIIKMEEITQFETQKPDISGAYKMVQEFMYFVIAGVYQEIVLNESLFGEDLGTGLVSREWYNFLLMSIVKWLLHYMLHKILSFGL